MGKSLRNRVFFSKKRIGEPAEVDVRIVSGKRKTARKANRVTITTEGLIMDSHFHEYLAAVAGMQELYGEPHHEGESEFHSEAAAFEPSDLGHALEDAECCGSSVG
jgi:hypothetical protein